jgi:hypothetical protein
VRDRFGELEALGAAVLVISFSPPQRLAGHRARLRLPFPIASDADRLAYRAYGLGRGATFRIWHPRTLLRYARLLVRGMSLQRPAGDEDPSQLGGDFVVDGAGRIRFMHRSTRPDDRPSVAALVSTVRQLRPGAGSA